MKQIFGKVRTLAYGTLIVGLLALAGCSGVYDMPPEEEITCYDGLLETVEPTAHNYREGGRMQDVSDLGADVILAAEDLSVKLGVVDAVLVDDPDAEPLGRVLYGTAEDLDTNNPMHYGFQDEDVLRHMWQRTEAGIGNPITICVDEDNYITSVSITAPIDLQGDEVDIFSYEAARQ